MINNELRNEQKVEAIELMKLLHMSKNAIKALEESDKVWLSEGRGSLYELEAEELKLVKALEEKHQVLVYHVIRNLFEFGECYSMLMVPKSKKEWKGNRRDTTDGYPFVYVYNKSEPNFSEFGSIGIRSSLGGLVRTA